MTTTAWSVWGTEIKGKEAKAYGGVGIGVKNSAFKHMVKWEVGV